MKRNQWIALFLIVVSMISALPLSASANKILIFEQIGFDVDDTYFAGVTSNVQREIVNYYDGQIVGRTTIDLVGASAKELGLGEKTDLSCIRILTEPYTITVKKKVLFITYNKTMKFGISSLRILNNYYSDISGVSPSSVWYYTAANSPESFWEPDYMEETNNGYGCRLDCSSVATRTAQICDCDNASDHNKTDLTFTFGKPKTTIQKERVYEQTYYYISQTMLNPSTTIDSSIRFIITPTYSCGSAKSVDTGTFALEHYGINSL